MQSDCVRLLYWFFFDVASQVVEPTSPTDHEHDAPGQLPDLLIVKIA
jgi:hypothetical protein